MPRASGPDRPQYAVVLAGGSGRRLGTVDKPALSVHGRTLLDIALAAVVPALTVVVGPTRELPPSVLQTRERPPGGGPAAAVAAGVEALAERLGSDVPPEALVAVLAADLPGVTADAIGSLASAVSAAEADGGVLTDQNGRDQVLVGVWRFLALRDAVRQRPTWHGLRVAELVGPLIGARLMAAPAQTADVDTPEDLHRLGIEAPGPGAAD